MLVLPTVEVRWFFDSSPFSASEYFSEAHKAAVRTDWYALPSDLGCGIKIREGRLETKLRESYLGKHEFLTNMHGNLERWKKWSCEIIEGDVPTDEILTATNWFALDKERYVRRFEVSNSGVVETFDRPQNGCSFELTLLRASNRTWFTVGFEANGNAEQLHPNLLAVARYINEIRAFGDDFRIENSYGYPEWLNQHMGCTA